MPSHSSKVVRAKIKRALPTPVLRAYRAAAGRVDRDHPIFSSDATPGPLARLYEAAAQVPGYFTYDDAVAFTLMLRTQQLSGMTGDVFEIGTYHGRSTIFLAAALGAGERLVVCDTFEADIEDDYPELASPAALRRTVQALAPGIAPEALDIREGRSDQLSLGDARFRFIHIDGGHTTDVAFHDLELAARHLLPGGIIAVDDYQHPWWPEVTTAADRFIERSGYVVLADVNRWAEPGRKLYLRAP